jgi:site-specific recombinase XerD
MSKSLVSSSPAAPLSISLNARAYLNKSISANTRKAYANAWRDFEYYCNSIAGVRALPCSPQNVLDYLTYLADAGVAVATIDQRVAAIAFMHRLGEYEDPTAPSVVRQLLSGIRRRRAELGERQRHVAPLMRDDLFMLVAAIPDDLRGLRDKALLLLTFAIARRESEVAALTLDDVRFIGARHRPSEMIVTIQRSKTDQEGEGQIKRIPRLSEESEMICPVRAVRAWLDASEITAGALFRKVDRWGKVSQRGINARTVEFIVERTMKRIGRDPKLYGGHSLRVGFVTQAAEDGTPLHEIMDVTDHKSMDMVRRYIRNQGLSTPRTIKRTLGE